MATKFHTASVAVHDAIQKSNLISSTTEGPPARYRLITTRSNIDENGSVRKWTFGQQDVNMHNKIILIVGETGTGKTTLINAMANYILGVKFKDEVWFEITEEGEHNDVPDQSKSQTSKITVYEVFGQDNPICLTIIDTPGYGDTRGTNLDKKIAENLYKLFRSNSGVKEIDAVCLVLKASENRLSNRQQYIFDAVLSLFGKDIENNIVIFVTYSDGMPPTDVKNAIKRAEIPCRKDEEDEPECFLFNNRQTEKRSEKYNRPLQSAWEQTEDSLNHFFDSLKNDNRKSLEQTSGVLSESKQLEACINNLQFRIKFVESKSKDLVQIQKALQENREKIEKDKNFPFTVTKTYKVKVPIGNVLWQNSMATTCSVCEENCHEYDCWAALNAWWCYVMKHDHCTVCTGKCHYTKHVRENKKYVTRSRQTIMTYADLKKQYETNSNSASGVTYDSASLKNVENELESKKKQEEEMKSIENRLKEDVSNTEKEKSELVEEACTAIMKLCEIALKPDSAFIIQALDFLIPRAQETGKPDLAQKLEEMRNIRPESEERVHAAVGMQEQE
ncbi:hypothetical protein HF521_020155 [Silurus meridionalis]|uniref:AAA+ ATPase domain-containing protein n=1 Tax=Silurus meridionalis TaxID=175797 RepID=A0A8T0BI80_SILME|nr:hypothetical protein HF521_020155 [Silurus meridionalis]